MGTSCFALHSVSLIILSISQFCSVRLFLCISISGFSYPPFSPFYVHLYFPSHACLSIACLFLPSCDLPPLSCLSFYCFVFPLFSFSSFLLTFMPTSSSLFLPFSYFLNLAAFLLSLSLLFLSLSLS